MHACVCVYACNTFLLFLVMEVSRSPVFVNLLFDNHHTCYAIYISHATYMHRKSYTIQKYHNIEMFLSCK